MFTPGQIKFSIFFVIVFLIAMVYVYRKDIQLHKTYYKGSLWVLIGFIAFIGLLFVLKTTLK
ncbi:putative membrane protein [Flavobacterium sp. HSC-61S13]|nr:hypothetical protein [Flavobacterium sp. HSC-61S13]MCP1997111.1 putative membrane protein [Flavobacterium sp. HSC-61S13]